MAVALTQVITEDRASGGQVIDGSLRFDDDKRQYLRRAFTSEGNRRTFTWSCWLKLASFGDWRRIFTCEPGGSDIAGLAFRGDGNIDGIRVQQQDTTPANNHFTTSAVYRDPNAWYHLVMAVDTTLATASDRIKVYVNGELQSGSYTTGAEPAQNSTWFYNSTSNYHEIGSSTTYNTALFDGHMTQCYWIDGQALGPEYFGYTDPLTNTWRPKKFDISKTPGGSWGTNGFYLPMDGNSPIGEDKSGNGNDWTPVNFGGSKLSEATGAIPLLNTNDAGTVAMRGIRTDKKTYTVTASGGKYYLDGVETPTLNFLRGGTYIFDYTGATSHPFKFSTTSDGTHGGGSEYTDGTNTATSNVMKITVPHNAPDTLYYYCSNHSGMGSSINVTTDIHRADPYAWKCMFAMASDAVDISPEINVNSTASVFTDVHTTNPQRLSNFYGTSKKMEEGGGFRIDWGLTTAAANAKHKWGTGDFTIECWHYTDGVDTSWKSYYRAYTYENATAGASGISHYGLGETLLPYWRTNTSVGNFGQTGDIVPYRRWNHTVWLREGTENRMYVNGILVKTFTDSKDWDNRGFEIGDLYTWGGGYQDARIYVGVAKYTSNFVVGSIDPDIVQDTPSGVAYSSALTKSTDGSVYFDGSSDSLTFTSTSDVSLDGDFTAEFWVYNNTIVPDTADPGLLTFPTDGTAISQIYIQSSSNSYKLYKSGIILSANNNSAVLNRWQHVAFTRSGTTIRVFVDGVFHNSTTNSDTFGGTSGTFLIGSYSGTTGDYNGFISNVRILKGTALYTSDFTPPTRALTNITNTKLLCCQSTTSGGSAAVSPNLGGVNNGTVWSEYLTDTNGAFQASYPVTKAFNGIVTAAETARASTTNTTSTWTPPGGISYTTSVEVWTYYNGTVSMNGGSSTNVVNVQDWTTIASGSGTLNYLTFVSSASSVYLGGVRIDGNILVDPVTANGNATATNFNPFTTDIDAVRGQESGYPSLNPLTLRGTGVITNNNLVLGATSGDVCAAVTVPIPTDKKIYLEAHHHVTAGAGNRAQIGVVNVNIDTGAVSRPGGQAGGWAYDFSTSSGNSGAYDEGTRTAYPEVSDGDICMWCIDLSAGLMWAGKNGIWFNSGNPAAGTGAIITGIPNTATGLKVSVDGGTTNRSELTYNFGQTPFKYIPPDGFQPLNAANARPSNVILNPDKYFKTVLWTGDGNPDRAVTGVGFKPDFVWIANRDRSTYKPVYDTVRGATYMLRSNTSSESASFNTVLTSFDSDGFTVGTDTAHNADGEDLVAWCWTAGGNSNTYNIDGIGYATASAAGLDGGSGITLTGASVGTKQGFSILRYTGGASGSTLSHGLTQAPDFWIIKNLSGSTQGTAGPHWYTKHKDISGGKTGNDSLFLNLTNAQGSNGPHGICRTSGNSLFEFVDGSSNDVNWHTHDSAATYICYAWHDVPGLQKFGTYEGNDGTDNAFVNCGFKPAMIIIKNIDALDQWHIADTTRKTVNPINMVLRVNLPNAEVPQSNGSAFDIDFLSNGFKIRGGNSEIGDPVTYIYAAWAEAPSFNLYGAQANAR